MGQCLGGGGGYANSSHTAVLYGKLALLCCGSLGDRLCADHHIIGLSYVHGSHCIAMLLLPALECRTADPVFCSMGQHYSSIAWGMPQASSVLMYQFVRQPMLGGSKSAREGELPLLLLQICAGQWCHGATQGFLELQVRTHDNCNAHVLCSTHHNLAGFNTRNKFKPRCKRFSQ